MKLVNKIKMYINLFFSINKNMFYEKYKFINISDKNKTKFYAGWYFIKNYILILAGICVLNSIFDNYVLCGVILSLMMLSCFMQVDALDWKAFERNDYMLAVQSNGKRCLIVLMGNLIYNLFINTNIFLYGGLIGYFLELDILTCIGLMVAYVAVYILISLIYFVLRNSTISIKKVYSLINYIFSLVSTVLIIYFVLRIGINLIRVLITRATDVSVSDIVLLNEFEEIYIQITDNSYIVAAVAAVIVVGVILSYIYTLWKISTRSYKLKDDSKYTVNSFGVVSAYRRIFGRIFGEKKARQFLNKEFALFTDVYKYNFRDYWFVFIADRAVAILLAILMILYQYDFYGRQCILLCIFPMFLMLDINSATSVKMIVNMSFISDYNTILAANTNGIPLKELLKSKMKFFYGMKSVSYIIYFAMTNYVLNIFECSWYIYVAVNVLCLLVLAIMPKIYLTNNLIYTRINYRDYEKYLEESQVLEHGIGEFLPINLLYKGMCMTTFVLLFFLLLGPVFNISINQLVYVAVIVPLFVVGMAVCYIIMRRINSNIISFIEGGDYSADFAKIFKK